MRCCVCGIAIGAGQPAMRHDPSGAIYCYPHEGLYLDYRLMSPSDYGRCPCGFVYSAEHRSISVCPQCGSPLGSAPGATVSADPPELTAVAGEPDVPPPPAVSAASPALGQEQQVPPPSEEPVPAPAREGRTKRVVLLSMAAVLVALVALFVMRSNDKAEVPSLPPQTYLDPEVFHEDLQASGIDCPGFGGVVGWSTKNPGAYGETAWGNCQIDEQTTISLRIYRSPGALSKGIALIQDGPLGEVVDLIVGDRWVVMINEPGDEYLEKIPPITGGSVRSP